MSLPAATYPDVANVDAFQSELLDRLEAIPGVAGAGAVDKLPFGTRWGCGGYAVEGRPLPQRAEDWPCAESRAITPGYPAALGMPLRRGRMLTAFDDAEATGVVLVNETFARLTWPDGEPLGQMIAWAASPEELVWRTVVGVVGDVRHRGLGSEPLPEVYMPYRQAPDRRMSVILRATAGDPGRLAGAVRGAVRELDPILPLRNLRTFDEIVAESVGAVRAGAWTTIGLGIVALFLAVIGIYGVLAYFVAQRIPEFGLRLALGASRRDIARLVISEGLRTSLIGATVGLVIAFAGARVLRGVLFDVSPTDPVAFGAVTVLLIAVSVLASWLPARRALEVDPTEALRTD